MIGREIESAEISIDCFVHGGVYSRYFEFGGGSGKQIRRRGRLANRVGRVGTVQGGQICGCEQHKISAVHFRNCPGAEAAEAADREGNSLEFR